MCGVFGELAASTSSATAWTSSAREALQHRGPDGFGLWSDDHAILGHLRLAILDLTDAAAQPMPSSTGRSVIAFNGEIYNFKEIRERLQPPQHGWRSSGDTEVLIELLEQRGLDGLSELHGMFALACWRPQERSLWLVRDRLGKKPLYHARTPSGGLRFASEVSAILADGAVNRSTTADRLAEFLQHGYVAAPRTGFANVSQLEPGHVLIAQLRPDGRIETSTNRFWSLPRPRLRHARREDWDDEFDQTLRDAVRIRLRSDVPLGAFLSGGIDSSVVSLLATREMGQPLRTFTVDFAEAEFSEAAYAAEVAGAIGTRHQSLKLLPEMATSVDDLVRVYGDLHGDSSALPTIALCAATRREVTVALSGDGGDELLGGYTRYRTALTDTRRMRDVPNALAAAARWAGRRAPVWIRGPSRLGRLTSELDAYYEQEIRSYAPRDWPPVLRRDLRVRWTDAVAGALHEHRERAPLQRLMATDIQTYLPEDVLVKVDRASMSRALEVRSPLLDHRLFELTMVAEPTWLMDESGAKAPLRRLYAQALPPSVFSRRKMGFGVPLRHWLRADLATLARSRLLQQCSRLTPLLDRRAVGLILFAHASRLRDESTRIWHLLLLGAWLEHWNVEVVPAA